MYKDVKQKIVPLGRTANLLMRFLVATLLPTFFTLIFIVFFESLEKQGYHTPFVDIGDTPDGWLALGLVILSTIINMSIGLIVFLLCELYLLRYKKITRLQLHGLLQLLGNSAFITLMLCANAHFFLHFVYFFLVMLTIYITTLYYLDLYGRNHAFKETPKNP